jgi:hypothetical protein
MPATKLPTIVACPSAMIRNDQIQPPTDPILIVTLEAEDKSVYLLPLSEAGVSKLYQIVSDWRRGRDFLSEQEPPEPSKLQ